MHSAEVIFLMTSREIDPLVSRFNIVHIFSCHAICWTRSENQVSISCEIGSYEFLEVFLQPKTSSIFRDSEVEVATVHRQNTNTNTDRTVHRQNTNTNTDRTVHRQNTNTNTDRTRIRTQTEHEYEHRQNSTQTEYEHEHRQNTNGHAEM